MEPSVQNHVTGKRSHKGTAISLAFQDGPKAQSRTCVAITPQAALKLIGVLSKLLDSNDSPEIDWDVVKGERLVSKEDRVIEASAQRFFDKHECFPQILSDKELREYEALTSFGSERHESFISETIDYNRQRRRRHG